MSYFDDASLVMIPSGYKDQKVYSVKPIDGSGDLTFSRASNASRINSSGLVEKVRTNIILYSNDFSNAAWISNNAFGSNPIVTPNYGTAPDGTQTATRVQLSRTSDPNSYSQLYQYPVNITSGVNYTVSVWLKSLSGTPTISFIGDYGRPNATLTSDWVLYKITFTALSSVSQAELGIFGATYASGNSESADFLAWGYQWEEGDIATDRILTQSTAVSVGPVSGLPRLDYSGGCPSLLLEPQRTNLALYSEQFDNTYWGKTPGTTITANTATSPDGYQNADTLTFASGSGAQAVVVYSGINTTYTLSVYAKSSTGKKFRFKVWDNVADTYSSDFTTTSTWQRFTYTFSSSIVNFAINNEAVGAAGSIEVWGAQLEEASYATSYIPTLSTAVTRVADFAYKTGISSLFGASAGTFLMHFKYTAKKAAFGDYLFDITDSTNTNRILAYCDGNVYTNQDSFVVYDSAVGGWGAVQFTYDQEYKLGIVYDSTSVRWYINGVYIGNGGAFPYQMSQIYLGVRYSLSSNLKTDIKETLIFPTALTATQMAELTTL